MTAYEKCPIFENDEYLLRKVTLEDAKDLLKVYSDQKAVPFFNSDNCDGDDFYYTTEDEMKKAIQFWLSEYDSGGFIRWTIISKQSDEAIGTIEQFKRIENDYFTNCDLLRLDLRSDFENKNTIQKILSLVCNDAFEILECDKIATKAISSALERRVALKQLGFQLSNEKLIGYNGQEYDSYFVLTK